MKALLLALSTLTPLPLSPKEWSKEDMRRSVLFYPLAGLGIGWFLAHAASIPKGGDLKALLTLVLWVGLTAAFHLDGLSDCLDGFFGGATAEERRRIMKDPAVGAYGVAGIVLLLLSKYVLLAHLAGGANLWKWLPVILMGARWGVLLTCLLFKAPAEDKGLGSQVVGLPLAWFLLSSFIYFGVGYWILGNPVFWVFLLACGVVLIVGFFSKNQIGGVTGDVMGATIELTEVVLLILVVHLSSDFGGFKISL